jgi:UDP-N-acetylglucosamine 4,6-dehydratase/UDP-glucose 4-epimerase
MILITGGTGFLGEELIQRLFDMDITNIRVVARNEGKLIELREKFPIEIYPGDISDPFICQQACDGVDIVYHLAAFKHVGMAESFPTECTSSNVIGSLNLLDETLKGNIKTIIGISTDKAEQVQGVYGATKLIMEKLFDQYSRFSDCKYRIVRYGNVLYSTGSVLCKWKKLIEGGKQCTITDPEATRFYWSKEKAVDLIFECLDEATDVTPWCPQMKGVKIGKLLEVMTKKYGDGFSHYKTIGLQPGENLHEKINGQWSNEVEQYTSDELMKIL